MRVVAWIMLLVSIFICMIGCRQGSQDAQGNENEQVIARDFYTNQFSAREKYLAVWKAKAEGERTPAVVSIAGEMLIADPSNYHEYYEYIMQSVNARDERVVNSAARALQNAKGIDSVRKLFALAQSDNEVIAHTAVVAIRYRYEAAKNASGRADEYEYIKEQISLVRNTPTVQTN